MSIKSLENPNLARGVSLASGINSTQVKSWLGRIEVLLEKGMGREALAGHAPALACTPVIVRPEEEPERFKSQCWLRVGMGRKWLAREVSVTWETQPIEWVAVFLQSPCVTTIQLWPSAQQCWPIMTVVGTFHRRGPHGSHHKWIQMERALLKGWFWHHGALKRGVLLRINDGSELYNQGQRWSLGNIPGFLCPEISGRFGTE